MANSLFAGRRNNQQPQTPTNNTMEILLNAAQSGKLPQDVLPQLAKRDPVVMQAMQIISGNAPQAVTGIIQNLAAKRGVTIPALIQRLGIK